MKIDRHYADATEQEKRDVEMQDEIDEISKLMDRYFFNVDSLLSKERANNVRKHVINRLIEQL
jgi:hypothetical protein